MSTTYTKFALYILTAFLAVILLGFGLGGRVGAQFNPVEDACLEGTASESPICDEAEDPSNRITGSGGILETATNLIAMISGIIAVIIVVVAGMQMIFSNGDPQKLSSARSAIIYASVGIVVIVLARQLVVFVIKQVG